jgi:hypothetical protein
LAKTWLYFEVEQHNLNTIAIGKFYTGANHLATQQA